MCRDHAGTCAFKDCTEAADCKFDPFCKTHRAFMYDNGDGERFRFPKYEVGD